MKQLRKKEEELQLELDLISEAAIDYAKKENISNISGSDFILKIIENIILQFAALGLQTVQPSMWWMRRVIWLKN